MPETVRQKIIDAVIARMQLIKVASGYETDLGNNVVDWDTNFDDTELPALSVCDLIETVEMTIESKFQKQTLPIQLRIFSKENRAKELRKMIADIYKAIKIDSRWKDANIGLVYGTVIKQAGIIIREDEFKIGGGAVEIEITYNTKAFDAFDF
jgi:hypothetical protein